MEDYSINISVKKNSNIPNDLAEIVNFHFSHYKSMGTISCHSNQSSYPTRINKSRTNGPINAHLTIAQVMPRYNHNNEKQEALL